MEGPVQGLRLVAHPGDLQISWGCLYFLNVSDEENLNAGAQAPGAQAHITGPLTTLARALVVLLQYVWLTIGSPLYNRVASNTNRQPETFGGTTNAEDGLAFVAALVVET